MSKLVKNIKWGIAPIGWRNDDIPEIGAENTYKQILSDAKLAGFSGTEVGGCYPSDPKELNKELALRDLQIISQWFSSFIIRDGVDAAVKAFEKHCAYLEAVDADVAVVSEQTHSIQGIRKGKDIYTDKPYFTDQEWTQLATGLNELGKVAQRHNVKLAYHHHMGTGVQTLSEVDRLMELTDPSVVNLVYDTGHIYVSDGETMPLLKKYFNRIVHVHLKDVRNNKLAECKRDKKSFLDSFLYGIFTVPGDGNINFSEVLSYLVNNDYQGWVVIEAEQDPKVYNPLEYAKKGRRHLDGLLDDLI